MAKPFPERLADFPGLRTKVWNEEMVRVAQDWALEQGYDAAEAWITVPAHTVRAGMEAGVEPLSMSEPHRRIVDGLRCSYDAAIEILGVIKGTIHPETYEAVREWVRQCYNRPRDYEIKMEALNEIAGGFGVSPIYGDDDQQSLVAEYISTGDTYDATIVRLTNPSAPEWDRLQQDTAITDSGQYLITTMGDVVEELDRWRAMEEQHGALILEWNNGYDLDGGGYSFEIAEPRVSAAVADASGVHDVSSYTLLAWERPDLDYVTGGDAVPGRHGRRPFPDLLLIRPGGDATWPHTIRENGTELHLLAEGVLFETDHECYPCEGRGFEEEEEEEERTPCARCDGDGYVISPGGAYGIYERREVEEEPPRRPDETLHYR